MIGLPRYTHEILAWEYDQRQPEPLPGELEWYLHYAALCGDPLLELACGSGRLLGPIARAGHETDGVDNAPAMLERLKAILDAMNQNERRRVRLFCRDMSEFLPDRRYGMVFVAFNSLQYLETAEAIGALFKRATTWLRQDGRFLFAVRRLDPSSFAFGERVVFDFMDEPVIDVKSGIRVGSRMVSNLDTLGCRIINRRTYVITHLGVDPENISFTSYTPVIGTEEYVGMLHRAGFSADVSGGYDGRSDDGMSKEVCFVCRLRG